MKLAELAEPAKLTKLAKLIEPAKLAKLIKLAKLTRLGLYKIGRRTENHSTRCYLS